MRALVVALWVLLTMSLAVPRPAFAAQPGAVVVLDVQGVINPVSAGYITRGIRAANESGAEVVVLKLNTPGGLDTSMRKIIEAMLESRVPVVVYVSPAGGRAASAGTFIALAAHVAAMAPNTTMGAAHPVAGSGQAIEGPMGDKVLNDSAGYIRSLAEQRGRNAAWAERAVRESVVVTEREAKDQNIVEIVATDLDDLLGQLEGRTVPVNGGQATIETATAPRETVEMDFAERVLDLLSDPNIAYLLLSLGGLAIFFELQNPGAIFPGVVGAIALVLGLFALGTLPVNYAGLALMGLAFVFFFAEFQVQSHGVLGIGGAIAFAIGSLMLINSSAPYFEISRPLIVLVVGTIVATLLFVVGAAVKVLRSKPVRGLDSMLGTTGEVRTLLDPKGTVMLLGERWEAESESGPLAPGEKVVVTAVDGLQVKVARASEVVSGRRLTARS